MSEKPRRFAVIGCGRMGDLHAERLAADRRSEVVALFDPLRSAAESVQKKHAPYATIYDSFERLVREAEVDAAVICTPTTSHFEQVEAVAERGWHVLCEKPLAESRARIERLIELSTKRPNQHFAIAYQRRHSRIYRRLREEVLSARWGQIRAVTLLATERWQQTIGGTWRDDPSINIGGFVGDAGSHKIDMLFYATGRLPIQVMALSERAGSQVEIVTSVIGRLTGGIPFSLSFVGHANSFVEEFSIHCEHADLMIRGRSLWLAQNNETRLLEEQQADAEQREHPIRGFLDLLDGTTANHAPLEIALPVWDFTQEILKSASSGQLR